MTKREHPDDERTICLYESLLKEHGETYRALDWGSRKSQQKRFQILADIGISAGDHILDVGCGLADFNAWLLDHRPGVKYSGIDITPGMVSTARARFTNANILNGTIFDQDLLHDSFDYLVASGIFFLRKDNPKKYMESTIFQMYQFSRKGIAFNSLSAWMQERKDDEFYAVPAEIMEFCKSLSPFVVLRHDYHPGDFTVYVYRTLTN